MGFGRLWIGIGTVVGVGLLAGEASALSLLQSVSRACSGQTCEFTPVTQGAGASTDILRTYTQTTGPNTYAFQASAATTVFGYDHWAVEAHATGDAHLTFTIPGGAGPSASAGGEAHLLDSVIATGATGAGTLRMIWRVTGSVDVGWSSSDPSGMPSPSPVQLVFGCSAGPAVCPGPRFGWTASAAIDETVNIDIPVTFGSAVQYHVSMTLVAGTGVNATFADEITWSGFSHGDFASTGVLQQVLLLDAFGNVLDPAGIESESGFRYDLVGQNVPEPSRAALGLAVALALAGRRALRSGSRPSAAP